MEQDNEKPETQRLSKKRNVERTSDVARLKPDMTLREIELEKIRQTAELAHLARKPQR